MRIKINFSENTSPVPMNNQHYINSFIHKCIGANNEYHNAKSDYSISMLCGGHLNENKVSLSFPFGGYIIVSSMDFDLIEKILTNIKSVESLCYGMKFTTYEPIIEKFYSGWNYFKSLSPFIIVKNQNAIGKDKFLTYDPISHEEFQIEVQNYLLNKLKKISVNKKLNLNLSDFKVEIPKLQSNKVKKIYIQKGQFQSKNYANACPINIYTNNKVAELLYDIGIGQSTGSGFGTIYKSENTELYRFYNPKYEKIFI